MASIHHEFRKCLHAQVGPPASGSSHRNTGTGGRLADKVVQYAVGKVLGQIGEEDFVGYSYGFGPGRGQSDALDALWVGIVRKKVNWILDAGIRGVFDNIPNDLLMRAVKKHAKEQWMVLYIERWLKA